MDRAMSPVLTETPGTGIAPPEKPSRWQIGLSTFAGYLVAALTLLLVVGLPVLGLIGFPNVEGRGLFHVYDGWSLAAEACAGLLLTSATAWAVARQIRISTGWEVPFGFTFLTLLVTGYAPALALTPFFWATAPVSLLLATWILHWRCEPGGAEPMRTLGRVPRRYRRRVAIGLAVAAPLMLGYALFYAAAHPLSVDGGRGAKTYGHEPGKLLRYELFVDNPGTADVTDVALVRLEGSPVLQLERPLRAFDRVELDDGAYGRADRARAAPGPVLPRAARHARRGLARVHGAGHAPRAAAAALGMRRLCAVIGAIGR